MFTAVGNSINVVIVAVLLVRSGSVVAALTTAVFVASEGVTAVVTIVIVTVARLFIVPTLQVTSPANCVQEP